MPLRRKLQHETHDIHQALHRHPRLAPLQSDAITRAQYADIIASFYSFYTSQEPRYTKFAADFTVEFRPLPLLRKDAQLLGLPLPSLSIQPSVTDEADFIGYLYVKQGSTLGGQVIAKHLEDVFGIERGKTLHFFNGAGRDTGRNWKAFEAYLDLAETRLDHDRIVSAAKAAFQALYDHMSEKRA